MISEQEIQSSKFGHIIKQNHPDKEYEFFWYGFKESIINFINASHNIKYSHQILEYLDKKSNALNILKEKGNYEIIKYEIEHFIVWIAKCLYLINYDDYHFSIYLTNLKRWNKWILHENDNQFKWMDIGSDKYFIIFFNLLTQFHEKKNKNNEIINLLQKYSNLKDKNYQYLSQIYQIIIDQKIIKPSIIEILDREFNVIDKLVEIGYLTENPTKYGKKYSVSKILIKFKNKNQPKDK